MKIKSDLQLNLTSSHPKPFLFKKILQLIFHMKEAEIVYNGL